MNPSPSALPVCVARLALGWAAPAARDEHGAAITTTFPMARAYVDQGLRRRYGFNHCEAQAALREALRFDHGGAMCAWGTASEAEAVYREDLQRDPGNGWSRFGLGQTLRARGRTADAAAVDARFRRAWARADVVPTASRL